jgi:hypothetical protein
VTKKDIEKAVEFLPKHHALSVRWYLTAAMGDKFSTGKDAFSMSESNSAPMDDVLMDTSFFETGKVPRGALRCVALELDLQSEEMFRLWALTRSPPIGEVDAKKLHTEMKSLKSDIGELKSDIAGLKSDIAGLRTEVTANSAKLDAILNKFGQRVRLTS